MRAAPIALLLLLCGVARAQTVSITQVGDDCPSRERVVAELLRIHPGLRVVEDEASAQLVATVADQGDRYVVVATQRKTLEDPARDCDERVRSTALILALALDRLPPSVVQEPRPPTATLPEPPRARPLTYALIDRPLVLTLGHAEATEEVTLGVFSYPKGSAYGTLYGFDNVLSADAGIGHRMQLGLLFAIPYSRNTNDITVLPRITVALHRDVALRVEAGFERTQNSSDGVTTNQANGAFLALALVTRIRLRPWLTVTFGDTGLRTELPLEVGPLTAFNTIATSQALLAISASPHAAFAASVSMPLGLLFQLHPMVALRFGTAIHMVFQRYGLEAPSSGVPTSIDLVVTPTRRIDLGALYEMPLEIATAGRIFTSALFARFRY